MTYNSLTKEYNLIQKTSLIKQRATMAVVRFRRSRQFGFLIGSWRHLVAQQVTAAALWPGLCWAFT